MKATAVVKPAAPKGSPTPALAQESPRKGAGPIVILGAPSPAATAQTAQTAPARAAGTRAASGVTPPHSGAKATPAPKAATPPPKTEPPAPAAAATTPAGIQASKNAARPARLAAAAASHPPPANPRAPRNLRCEYLKNPLGMDDRQPRLTWEMSDPERGAVQTAWEIQVASSEALLRSGTADLWDSGKEATADTFGNRYAGALLASGQRAWWRVREWDGAGKALPWSEPAWWETGVLAPEDWHAAQWISNSQDVPLTPADFKRLVDPARVGSWITDAGDQTATDLVFQCNFNLPPKEIVDAQLVFGTSDDHTRGRAAINKGRGQIQIFSGYDVAEVDVTTRLISGTSNQISILAESSSPHPAINAGLTLTYADGTSEKIGSDDNWTVGPMTANWQGGVVTGGTRIVRESEAAMFQPLRSLYPRPFVPPLLRKTFKVKPGLARARAYVCGLGYYEFYLNGARQGDAVLQPAQTNCAGYPAEHYPPQYRLLESDGKTDDKFAYYNVYDITSELKPGVNGAGIYLGDGFYNQNMAWSPDHFSAQGKPGAICLIRLDYQDGSSDTVVSDGSWKWMDGPILRSNEYFGEIYDARREAPGWSAAEFDDTGWKPAAILKPISPRLIAQPIPPMRRVREIRPASIRELQPGAWLVTYPENITGWVHLRVNEPEGTQVRLRFTDWLWPDGHLDDDASYWPEVDLYTTKGGGPQEWEPRFTDHAFQYMEVSGLKTAPTPEMLKVEVVHTDMEPAGEFACSNDLLNQEQAVALRTFEDNTHGRIEDCPTRERCEWGHNVQMAEAMMFNYEMAPLYTKYVDDFFSRLNIEGVPYEIGLGMRISRSGAGDVPSMNGPLEAADLLYRYYGDPDPGDRHYDQIKHFALWLDNLAYRRIIRAGGQYGDHAARELREPVELTSSIYYMYANRIWESIAKRLGKEDDAAEAGAAAEDIRKSIVSTYYDAEFDREQKSFNSQGADTLALYFNLSPKDNAEIAADLDQRVVASGNWLTGGMLSYNHVAEVLSEEGYAHEAFLAMTNTNKESFPWGVASGYTTIFEIYGPHGSALEQTVSHNHPNFGGVAQWFYKSVAGIAPDPDSPGFRHFFIRPLLTHDLDWARASYHAMPGWISASWQRNAGHLSLQATVPANSTATLFLPATNGNTVTESGMPAAKAKGVRFVRNEKDAAVFELSGGSYRFDAP
jgi:alpha-L-rhamnosidase